MRPWVRFPSTTVVAISNCSESEDLITAGYRQALERKNALRRDIDDRQPLEIILRNLRKHAEEMHAELGDMGWKK
jgi:DNA-directed RNA polymerase beta' subunit